MEIKEITNRMAKAIADHDYRLYNECKSMIEEAVDEQRKSDSLIEETRKPIFGNLNFIVEGYLMDLMEDKKGKMVLRKVAKTIMEDKNLQGQMKLQEWVRSYSERMDEIMGSKEYLEKALEEALPMINKKTVKESNKKLMGVLLENELISQEGHKLSEEASKLFEALDTIVTSDDKMSNLERIAEAKETVMDYMESHKRKSVDESKDVTADLASFIDSHKSSLNESEMDFLRGVIDGSDEDKSRIFENLKGECFTLAEGLKKIEGIDEDSMMLVESITDKLNGMTYNNKTIISSITKLLEFKDVLDNC